MYIPWVFYLASLPLHKAKWVQLNGKTLQVLKNSIITNLRWVPLRRFFRLNTRHSSSLLYRWVFQIVCVRTFLGILVRRNPWTDPCYQLGPEIRHLLICLFGNSNKLSVLFCDLPNICCCKTAWCWNRIVHNTCLSKKRKTYTVHSWAKRISKRGILKFY